MNTIDRIKNITSKTEGIRRLAKGGDLFSGMSELASAVDKDLDSLGTWGKLAVQVLDPTGVTGWEDAKKAYKDY